MCCIQPTERAARNATGPPGVNILPISPQTAMQLQTLHRYRSRPTSAVARRQCPKTYHPASRSRPPQCSALAPAPEVSVAVGNHLRTAPRWCTAAPATGAARGQRRRRRRRAAAAASLRSRSGPPLAPPSQLASRPYCCAREASRSQLSSRSLETFCSSPQASIPMPRYALQSGCMRRGLCAGGAPGSSR